MEIQEQTSGAAVIVSLDGRLDGFSAPDLETRVAAIIARGDVRVVLDCERMEYISSAGLRVLLTGARQCQQNDGALAICGLKPDCRSVLEVSGFLSILDCRESRTDAVAAVSGT